MKRGLREPCLSWREEGAVTTDSGALAARVFVAKTAGEGRGRVLNHPEKAVGELVEAEVDVSSRLLVVVKATTVHGRG